LKQSGAVSNQYIGDDIRHLAGNRGVPSPECELQSSDRIGASFAGSSVLLAEDEDQLLYSYSLSLQILGFQVIAVSNGKEALESFQNYGEAIGLLILDVSLPLLSGLEALKKIRMSGAKTPAIVISGHGESLGAKSEAKRLGARFLGKPFGMKEMQQMVTSLAPGRQPT